MSEEKVWGIHRLFLENNVIAIGWHDMGDLSLIENNRESFKEKYREIYPEASKNNVANCAGTLFRFAVE